MKCIAVPATLLTLAVSQLHGKNQLAAMVNNEVSALVAADSGLTLDACTTKCDALFDFIDATDEATTDKMCASACDCEVNNKCTNWHNTHNTHNTHNNHNNHGAHP